MKRRYSNIIVTLLVVLIFLCSVTLTTYAEDGGVSKVRVLIEFDRTPGMEELVMIDRIGGHRHHTYWIVPAVSATLPTQAIKGLLNNPRILSIVEDVEIQADNTEIYPWGVTQIDADFVHTAGVDGDLVKVAIIDSGIALHEDLNIVGGYNFIDNNGDFADDYGHGTHVAGTIAALANSKGVIGVAPDVELYALKVLDSNGSGYSSDVIAAVEWCVDNGIHVTNNSYGSSRDPGKLVRRAFDEAYAAGILHISSAGNSGRPNGKANTVGYPAAYDSVIAVAATDRNDRRASFSSTGGQVELAAPGVDILSTVMSGGYEGGWNGTSMASPHVAGVAALIKSVDSNLTNVEIREIMTSTAFDLGDTGRDNWFGYGLVDADDAVATAGIVTPPPNNTTPTVSIIAPSDGHSLDEGNAVTFAGEAFDAEEGDLSSVIKWTSDIDGSLGYGESVTVSSLSTGTHIITASVTDNSGLTANSSIAVTVNSGDPVGDEVTHVYVADVDFRTSGGRNKDLHLAYNIILKDNLNQPVADAQVSGFVNSNYKTYNFSGITGSDGSVSFKIPGAPPGTYIIMEINVIAPPLIYVEPTEVFQFTK